MEFIQEPSCCQEGHDGDDGSREEEYKVVLDFSFYCVIDGSSIITSMIHNDSDSSQEAW